MSDVFYLRSVDPPATPGDVLDGGRQAGGCLELHSVAWMHSFLSAGGRRILCWYRAPDAESARLALRELGSDMDAVWPGRVVGGVEPGEPAVERVEGLAELALPDPGTSEEELVDALRQALPPEAELPFGFLSNRRDRMVCLLRGGELDAIRSALESGGFPGTTAWPCTVVTPR